MNRLLLCLLLTIALPLTACDSGDSGPPRLDGDYIIETQGDGSTFTFEVTLNESDHSLFGDGTLTIEDQSSSQAATSSLDVIGSHHHPDARIQMTDFENGVSTLDGEVSDDAEQISGTITFPSGLQQEVTMRRD